MGKNFTIINAIQFIDALVENLFKYIVIYYLISETKAFDTSNIMALTGAIFVLPFILFSSVGGWLADRLSKSRMVLVTRLFSSLCLAGALLFVEFHGGNLIYIILFAVAASAAIFGPSKYGIVPELIERERLTQANGYLASFTYFGIIFGTGLASFLNWVTKENFTWMVAVSLLLTLLGVVLSFALTYTKPSAPNRKWPLFIYKEVFIALKEMYQIPKMWIAVFCCSYFIFIGAFAQMNIIPYCVQILRESATLGGYFFLVAAVGIGIGSLIAPKINGRLHHLPWIAAGMSLGCFLFTFFSHPIWLNLIWIVLLGIFGGLFLVPSQAYIMANSPHTSEGRNFGTTNLLSYIFALLAAGTLYLFSAVFGMDPAMSFFGIGIVNLAVSSVLYFLLK
jgi:acyl-[acyl-carrier-protein]-phospholipid O-acyltransferase/long-chain-fatty-acid--[acyl-carrier-protein] ligase